MLKDRLSLALVLPLAVVVSCTRVAALPAAEHDQLLEDILAVQTGTKQLGGVMLYEVFNTDSETEDRNQHRIKFTLELPRSFFLEMIPLIDGKEQERREWHISNGSIYVSGTRFFADEDTEWNRPKEVKEDEDDLGSLIRLVAMNRSGLDKKFAAKAAPLPEDRRLHDDARFGVRLVPKAGDLAKQLEWVEVQVNEGYRTVAVQVQNKKANRTVIIIESSDYDVAIPDGLFEWKP